MTARPDSTNLVRWAWVPGPVLLAAMLALWVANVRGTYDPPALAGSLDFLFGTLASVAVALLIGRNFVRRPAPGMLLLGSGMLIWGVGSVAASAVGGTDDNVIITIYNLCVWLGACGNLGSVLLSYRERWVVVRPAWWVSASYLLALVVVGLVSLAAVAGELPLFFVQGQGGTLTRQFVLGSSIIMLLLTAMCLRPAAAKQWSPFAFWYGLALVLLAAGLFGVMIEAYRGGLLSWTGRLAQYLGGLYMLMAVLTSKREVETPSLASGAWHRYAVAVALVAVATAARLVFLSDLGTGAMFITFYPAVILAALYGRLGPGLLATVLSVLVADYYWTEPVGHLGVNSLADWKALVIFFASGTLLSVVTEAMHRAQTRAAAAEERLWQQAERERAGEALRPIRQQNEFLARILQLSSQPFAVGYPDGRLGLVNHAYEILTGYSAQELRGLDWSRALTPPEWRERERHKLEELDWLGQPVRYEKEYVRKDGRRVAIELLVHVARDAAGKTDYFYSFLTDITERKLAEEQLRQFAAQLQASNASLQASRHAALNLLEDATQARRRTEEARAAVQVSQARLADFAAATFEGIVLTHEGHIMDCNEQFAQMVGRTVEQLKGTSVEPLIAPEDCQRVLANILNERDSLTEHQMLRADGTRITVEAHGRPSGPAGAGLRHTALRDITERKQREEMLQKLFRTLTALKDSSQAMMRAASETAYLNEVCKIVVRDCGQAMVWVGLAEEDAARTVRPVACAGFEEGYLQTLNITWADTERGRGPTGTAIRTAQPCRCNNVLTDPRLAPWRQEALKRGYTASLAIPLLAEGRAFGALTIYTSQGAPISEDEEKLLCQLADDVSYCIRALRLRAARERAERRTELLANAASQLLSADSPERVVDDLCHQVLEFLDCQVFFNFLLDEPSQRLHLNACGGIPAAETQRLQWLALASAVCGCVARDACCIVAENIQSTPDPRTDLVRRYGIQAYACHPFLAEGRVLGTLSFGTRTRTRFNPEELSLMKAVTDLVAIAMERQRTQTELRRTNEQLEQRVRERTAELQTAWRYARSLIEAGLDPLVTISPAGKITDVNEATEAATGVGRQQLIGSDFSRYFTEPAKAEAGYQAVLAEGDVRDYPLTIRHVGGRTTDVLYHATLYRDEAGQVLGVLATARDITERRQAEARRELTAQLLVLFAEKTTLDDYLNAAVTVLRRWLACQALGIRVVNAQGEIPYVAWEGFERQFIQLENLLSVRQDNCCCIRALTRGFTEPDRSALTPAGSYLLEEASAFYDALPPGQREHYRGNCVTFGFESVAIIQVRYREAVIGLVHLADRRPRQFPLARVEFLETLTPLIGEAMHRFHTEAELARHRDQLELLVQQRTQELTEANAQLQQTAEDLKRSNRDLEQFAYVASHDLQEPLRAVGGYVKLLERHSAKKLDARARELINGSFEGALRMERLINELLAFSRVATRGREPVPTPLEDALQQALANLHAAIESSQATITHDPLPTVPGDATQLMQVFQNLIGNAMKFQGKSPPQIHVGAQREAHRWVLSVRDNGIGIEAQYHEKIFQIFQRLHTRRQYPGTGMGLAICKRIVERHGGSIWVESQPGAGTTFFFSLPGSTREQQPR